MTSIEFRMKELATEIAGMDVDEIQSVLEKCQGVDTAAAVRRLCSAMGLIPPRPEITDGQIDAAMADLWKRIGDAFQKHGRKAFTSLYETYGALMAGVREFENAVQTKDKAAVRGALLDVAGGCIIGIASIDKSYSEARARGDS
jgi:hypothetical protein